MTLSRRARIFILMLCLALVSLALAEGLGGRRRRAEAKYTDLILGAANEFSVPYPLIYAVIRAESDFRADAVSPVGATGLMQLMPETYRFVGSELLEEPVNPAGITDPAVNIRYGTAYLSYLLSRFPVTETAIAAYNAGEARVAEWLSDESLAEGGVLLHIPFQETENYVAKVTRFYDSYCQKFHTERRLKNERRKNSE